MPPERVGRYLVFDEIAAGGMASVHVGRLVGPAGFGRIVAIKRLHAHLQKDPDFISMLLDEARIASRIYHPNVVQVLDVVTEGGVSLVLEYVHGESLWKLSRQMGRREQRLDLDIALAVVVGVLRGLHAAHETVDAEGQPLGIVHRDVSPHNILVDAGGTSRLLDFGVAKAAGRISTTRDGQIKGKLAYMAPEQLRNQPLDQRVDVYATSVVLWELITGERLFDARDEAATFGRILQGDPIAPPGSLAPNVPESIDAIVLRGLARDVGSRFETAGAMADALEAAHPIAPRARVAAWVADNWPSAATLKSRIAEIERLGAEVVGTGSAEHGEGTESAIDVSPAHQAADWRRAPMKRRRGGVPWPAAVAIAVTVAAVLVVVRERRAPADAPVPATMAASAPEPSAARSNDPGVSASVATPPETVDAPPLATLATPGGSASAASRGPGAAPPRAAAKAPRKRAACDPPWTLDAEGNHIWKRECFKR